MISNIYNNHILIHVLTKFEHANSIVSVTVGPRNFVLLTLNFNKVTVDLTIIIISLMIGHFSCVLYFLVITIFSLLYFILIDKNLVGMQLSLC